MGKGGKLGNSSSIINKIYFKKLNKREKKNLNSSSSLFLDEYLGLHNSLVYFTWLTTGISVKGPRLFGSSFCLRCPGQCATYQKH